MPDKYHYGFDLGNGKDESCLTIFRDEDGDTQVVEAVLYGKQAESVFTCLRSRDEQHRREVEEEIEARNAWWALMIKSHRCSLKGQSSLKDIVREGTGKHLLKWKLLYETLAAAVREEVPFPGETNEGRCPKCDDQVPCAYCIANVEPKEAQEQILSHSPKP